MNQIFEYTNEVNDVVVEYDVMVKTRDGINLATNIFLPSDKGKTLPGQFPALLQRTPYNKSAETRMEECYFFARRGYVVAFQDCRGRYASEGGFTKYTS